MKKIISNRTLLLITVQSYNEILIILTISGCKLAKLIIYQLNTSNTSRIKRKKGSQSTSFVHLLFFAILTWYNNQNIYIYILQLSHTEFVDSFNTAHTNQCNCKGAWVSTSLFQCSWFVALHVSMHKCHKSQSTFSLAIHN